MALRDPIAAYNARDNFEAEYVKNLLCAADIEAHITEDVSVVGWSIMGPIPEIHKPQVWINREDTDRAKPVLREYAQHMADRALERSERLNPSESVLQVPCESCDELLSFPEALRGSVQECPHCRAYVDVDDAPPPGDEEDDEPEDWPAEDCS